MRRGGLLHQADRAGQGGLAAAHGRLCGAATVALGGDIQADGRGIARHRLDVLDDEALALMGIDLPDLEVRLAIGTRTGQESGFLLARHPADVAEATCAGVLLIQVAGLAVALELLPADLRLADHVDRTADAAQTVLVDPQAGLQVALDLVRRAAQLGLQVAFVLPRLLPGGQAAEQAAEQQHQQHAAQNPGHG